MKYLFLALLTLTACSKGKAKSTASGITGIDAGGEYNRIASHLDAAAKLPRSGENMSITETFSSIPSGARCRYAGTYTVQISNVTADSLDETRANTYSVVKGDNCPAVPKDRNVGGASTFKDADYIASRKAEMHRIFDLEARRESQPLIQAIGIASSEATTDLIAGHSIPVQRITISVVNTNGVEFEEVHDFATESWFLGRVSMTLNTNGQSYPLWQVTTYNP